MVYKGPGGNFAILELDMYHPLPDFNNRFTQFKLGEIYYPPKPAPKPAPPPPPVPAPAPPPPPENPHDHHDGHELSEMELQDYLKTHPDTWVPPGYGKDRSDWFPKNTYNPYPNYYRQTPAANYIPFESNMLDVNPSNSYRMRRSGKTVTDYHIEEDEDRYNISHHRNWEHYYHYREKRDLYQSLEQALGQKLRFQMKSCILRAICEARSLLLPPGRSMMMDILRIVFSVPLKDDLQDEYSKAMRHENMDCHEVYGKDCSVSILYLILFGKFVT
ncbi:AAEL004018-PA [Aedes aegypti]|nr:AAEL004018-PA [Aedes aegypti]